MRKYFGKRLDKIEEMENRYDFIPVETNEMAIEKSLSQLCLRAVKDVAKARLRDVNDADKSGKNLKEYRDYAVENREKGS